MQLGAISEARNLSSPSHCLSWTPGPNHPLALVEGPCIPIRLVLGTPHCHLGLHKSHTLHLVLGTQH